MPCPLVRSCIPHCLIGADDHLKFSICQPGFQEQHFTRKRKKDMHCLKQCSTNLTEKQKGWSYVKSRFFLVIELTFCLQANGTAVPSITSRLIDVNTIEDGSVLNESIIAKVVGVAYAGLLLWPCFRRKKELTITSQGAWIRFVSATTSMYTENLPFIVHL